MSQFYDIIVIDDSETEMLFLRIALDEAGISYDLKEFLSADSAFKYFEKTQSAPHLIITDGTLPRYDCDDIIARLQQIEVVKTVPVVVISGRSDSHFRKRALDAGAADYILRPSDLHGWFQVGFSLRDRLRKSIPEAPDSATS